MIEKLCTEAEYRASDAFSYSSLKSFEDNPWKFYKEVMLGEKVEREVNQDMIMGNLVDCRLLDMENYEDRFCLSNVLRPKGQVGDLVDRLIIKTKANTDEDGTMQESFSLIFEQCFEECKQNEQFKGKTVEKGLAEFLEKGKAFYDECRNNMGKCVIDVNQLANSERVINMLKNSGVTSGIINLTNTDGIEVLNQMPIFYTYRGMKMRSLLDKMVINHNKKLISIWDLKCTHFYNNFTFIYLKLSYFLQQALYWVGVNEWAKENGMGDYTIQPMRFIAVHPYGHNEPIIWRASEEDVQKGLQGFKTAYRPYKGINELQDRLAYAIENDCWGMSREAHLNKGLLSLDIEYI